MIQPVFLLQPGKKVKVDLLRVTDRIPEDLYRKILHDPYGRIIDYKMTDGTDIGYILKFNDGSTFWFFSEEIQNLENQQSGMTGDINEDESLKDNLNIYNNNNEGKNARKNITKWAPKNNVGIVYLINPFNFTRWLLYSLKDVI